MNTTYKPRYIPSPYRAQRPAVQRVPYSQPPSEHPVRQEINKVLGSYNLTAEIKEDTATLATMKHIGGFIALICSLSRDGKVVAEGRGATVLGPNNKWLTRAVESAANSALAESMIKATRVLGTLLAPTGSAVSLEEAYTTIETQKNSEPATDKQISYLRTLIQTNVDDDHERDQWESQLHGMSKRDACSAIEQFVN